MDKEGENKTPVKEENKVPRQLSLHDAECKSYTLQFNRKTVLTMQRNGFVLDLDRLYMCARDLIQGAFRMHHAWMKWDEIEKVWTFQNKRGDLLGMLANMFSQPAIDLMGDAAEDEDDKQDPTFEIVY